MTILDSFYQGSRESDRASRRRRASQGGRGRRAAPAAAAAGVSRRGRRPAPRRRHVAHHGPRPLDGARRQHPRHAERDRGLLRRRSRASWCSPHPRPPTATGRALSATWWKAHRSTPPARRPPPSSTAPARSSASSCAAMRYLKRGLVTWRCATPRSTASASTTAPPTRSTSWRPTTASGAACARR